MKKKIFSFLLALALFIPCLFIFSACGKNDGPPPEPEKPNPANYTITDIQNLIHNNLSNGLGNVDINTVLFNVEFAKKSINGRNILGFNTNTNTIKYYYLSELKLITYKSPDNKYYYANKVINLDNDDLNGSVTFNSCGTSIASVELVKNNDDIAEFSYFELYLCKNTLNNTWHFVSYDGATNYTCGNELKNTQLNWFFKTNGTDALQFKDDLNTEVVHTDTGNNLEYYKVSLTNPTNKYLAKPTNAGYRLAEIGYTNSGVEINSSLITFLSGYQSTALDNTDEFSLYNINLNLNTFEDSEYIEKSIRVECEGIDNPDYYLVDENGEKLQDQQLTAYGNVNCKEFECLEVMYIVADNGKYYGITEYQYDSTGTPSFYESNSTIVIDSYKVELTKQEYESYLSDISLDLLNNIDIDSYIIDAQKEIDTITALFGANAYKSSFKISDGATADYFTAIIENTSYIDNFGIPNLYITNEQVDYIYNTALINEKISIFFSNSKLTSITVTWELQDQFKPTNTPNVIEPNSMNLLNEQEIFKITFMDNLDNLKNPNLDTYEDKSLTEEDEVEINLRNVFGGTMTISSTGELATPIKPGSTITRSSIDALVADRLPAGITIENWYIDGSFKVPAFENGIFTVPKSGADIHLFAKYNNMPTITLELDGGVMENVGNTFVLIGDNFEELSEPYKKGYEFVDFYTDAGLTNVLNYSEAELTSNVTLYAKYKKLYLVEFDTKGGKEVGNKFEEEGETTISLPSCVEKLGYVFKGWKLVGGDDTIYHEYNIPSAGLATNLKFEAVYDEGVILHIYNFDYNNKATLYKTITVNKTCPEGYSFNNLYSSLLHFNPYGSVFENVYLDAELTTKLTEWPTSECNLYLK